ncbi:oxidoreductase [Taibaiella sp. KBW10]|uniref:Gfo/Idh/MocA family protein n=1 Tax=Taibaiella sp. KBW10 TaxID=2153357 RepID=UPI000F5A4A25|nr:Gfo/Idh/MocA family oxidoreductase [Taibaiella sp. KBW10]RQO31946.1 oxidoreductase [Taibaiella sp. KBW10]
MSHKIKFIVIGCGHIGKRHAAMILNNPEAELVALVDIKDRNELYIDQYDAPFFNSYEELKQAGIDFDVANIAVPNGLHATLALSVLEDCKNVVIEKPLALSTREAQQIIDLAEKVERKVFVVMQNRYSPPSVWLKELVESGKLGQIHMLQMNCYWNRDERYYTPEGWHGSKQLDGGTLFTQFSHFIDILYWVFGQIKNIDTRLYDFNHQNLTEFEDSGHVLFELVQGGAGNINFSTAVWDKNLESSLTIIAEKGSVKIGGQYMDKVSYCHIKDYVMPELPPTLPGNDYGFYKGSAANHAFVIQNVIDVLNHNAAITTTVYDGLEVVHMIEQIYQAQYEKK